MYCVGIFNGPAYGIMYGVPWIWKASVWWVETWRDTDHLALYLSNRTLGLDAVVMLGALPHMTCPVKRQTRVRGQV